MDLNTLQNISTEQASLHGDVLGSYILEKISEAYFLKTFPKELKEVIFSDSKPIFSESFQSFNEYDFCELVHFNANYPFDSGYLFDYYLSSLKGFDIYLAEIAVEAQVDDSFDNSRGHAEKLSENSIDEGTKYFKSLLPKMYEKYPSLETSTTFLQCIGNQFEDSLFVICAEEGDPPFDEYESIASYFYFSERLGVLYTSELWSVHETEILSYLDIIFRDAKVSYYFPDEKDGVFLAVLTAEPMDYSYNLNYISFVIGIAQIEAAFALEKYLDNIFLSDNKVAERS